MRIFISFIDFFFIHKKIFCHLKFKTGNKIVRGNETLEELQV